MRVTLSRVLLSIGCVAVVFSAALSANHSWGGYHWARTTPQFTLKLGDNMTTAAWKSHLAQASSDWNSGVGVRVALATAESPLLAFTSISCPLVIDPARSKRMRCLPADTCSMMCGV